jgi:type I restriction enzyme M protein
LVLTNPPFGSLLGQEAFASLGDFSLANGRRRLPLELAGLERSIEFLRPGGRLAIVLPESFFSAESTKYARDWLTSKVLPRIVIDLPNETFAPFGANVRSGILFARKKFPGEKEAKANVCVIQMENLGYDASGRPISNSDLKETAKTCLEFLNREGW